MVFLFDIINVIRESIMKKTLLIISTLIVAALPLTAQQVIITRFTPDSSVRLAAQDLASVPRQERKYIRYLSLYNIPKEKRREVAQTVSFLVNSLGRRKKMYIPLFVGNSDETVIRLSIDQYDWNTSAWENLGYKGSGPKAQPEPYFHYIQKRFFVDPDKVTVEKIVVGDTVRIQTDNCAVYLPNTSSPYAHVNAGQEYKALRLSGKYVLIDHAGKQVWVTDSDIRKVLIAREVRNGKIQYAHPPWINPNAWKYLCQETYSEFPVLRADWFITNASVAPAYYEFLGLGKNIKDFQNLVFTNEDLAVKARSQYKGVVVTSIVARNNRTLLRSPTFTDGYYWQSHDSLTSVDERHYVQNVLHEKFDATEDIGSLPNGLQAYFLTDGKGSRLDFANPDIAVDNNSADRVVRNGRSCIICHVDGIRPINDEIRALTKKLQNRSSVALLGLSKDDQYRIEDLFGTDLDEKIVSDQNIYAAAVARSNGLKSEINARQFGAIWNSYNEILLDRETVSNELGIPLSRLDHYIQQSNDNVLLGLTKTPVRPVRRDQFEKSYQNMMHIIAEGK